MPWSKHIALPVGCALALLLAGNMPGQPPGRPDPAAAPVRSSPQAQAPASPAAAGNKEESAPGQAVQVATSDLSSLNRLLPVGKTARKVTVPTVDEEGRLTSVVTMGAITRVDEDNFDLEKVVLTSFDQPDQQTPAAAPSTTVITLISARYHAPSRVLASERPVTIRKPTLFMSGDSLHYDSAAGRAIMKGNTRAIITDAPSLEPSEDENASAAPDAIESEDEDEDEDETINGKEAASSQSTPKPK